MILAEAITPWAQFGLAGLVIATLFGSLTLMIRQHRTERSEADNLHREERKEAEVRHRGERQEWRLEATEREVRAREREEGLENVLMKLERAIVEAGSKGDQK